MIKFILYLLTKKKMSFSDLPQLPPHYLYSRRNPFKSKEEQPVDPEWEKHVQTSFFQQMRKKMESQVSPEHQEELRKEGEKYFEKIHHLYEESQVPMIVDDKNTKKEKGPTIDLEESLAYLTENLKSGLHPQYLTEADVQLIVAGYGNEWYQTFGYEAQDIPTSLLEIQLSPES